jgi:LAS superfamily LD-carboxypeptidase LdcB|tara:strand:+ start:346 stop:738 length:393 start_codon:yes stop_codon:yes gene_type:complete
VARNKGLPKEIVDTGIPNYSGVQTIKIHEDIADSLEKAMSELAIQGVALEIEDSFRYRSSQEEQYEASFGTAKEGLVAHPDSSYHVKGLAFDLAQTIQMRDDPRIADALLNVGFVQPRPLDEWWHWSIQE